MPDYRYAASPEDLPSLAELSKFSGLDQLRMIIGGEVAAPPISRLLGFRMVTADEGRVVFRGTPQFEAANPIGTTHGGWYGAILDSALACAVQSMVPVGYGSTTLEYKVNIIRPLPAGMEAESAGVASHVGRTTGVASAELRGVVDDKLYATGSTTCQVFRLPAG